MQEQPAETPLKNQTSGSELPTFQSIQKLTSDPEVQKRLTVLERADLLPQLFRVKGVPYSLTDYPQFKKMYSREYSPDTLFICGRQLGKTGSEKTLVSTDDGYLVTLKDIEVGDTVLTKTKDMCIVPRKVTAKFDHGQLPLIRIRTRTGSTVELSREHRLYTLMGYREAGTLHIGDRLATPRCGGNFGTKRVRQDRIALTAYMIGDGSCVLPRVYNITSGAQETIDDILCFSGTTHTRLNNKSNTTAKAICYRVDHPIYRWMQEDELHGHHAYDKFIPRWVFQLSKRNTALFLSRLWATDGCITTDPKGFLHITYASTSRRLIEDVRALLLKFGISVTVRTKQAGYRKNGVYKRCRDAHELRVTGADSQRTFISSFNVPGKPVPQYNKSADRSNRDTVPYECVALVQRLFDANHIKGNSLRTRGLRHTPRYALSRAKLEQYLQAARELGLADRPEYALLDEALNRDILWDAIVAIEDGGIQQTYDIEVEETHNFLANQIVSHNSLNLSRSEIMDMLTIPQFQILYVAPLQSQTQRYSTLYMNEAIQSCGPAKLLQQKESEGLLSDSRIVKAVHHQAFSNGAGVQLTYAKTSPDRARGIYADRIDFDEIQDQEVDNIPIISESMTSSPWGVRRFTGTAKTTDNTIESLWQRSSMAEWVMRCDACNFWNIPNQDNGVLEMIKPDGMHCIRCGAKLNVRKGEWVHAWPDREDTFEGYHISQVVVPAVVESPTKWAKVIRKVMTYPLPLLLQEVLGISCSVGARIVTQADIDRQSTLPTVKELQSQLGRYTVIVGGLDWGGAEQQSFTVHTIIGVRPEGKIDVLWARRFMGFDPDEVLNEVARAHRFYKCTMLAADYGMGFDKNIMLEQRFGLPVVQIMLMGNQHKLMSYRPQQGHPAWTVDKTTAMELLFLAIKYGRIFFPPQSEFKLYTDDLLSPYEDINESGGLVTRRFIRNPSKPDDFCMALTFGTLLAMKLVNSSIMDLVPQDAFHGGTMPDGEPAVVNINPEDVMAALQG